MEVVCRVIEPQNADQKSNHFFVLVIPQMGVGRFN